MIQQQTQAIISACGAFLFKTLRVFALFMLLVTALCLLLAIASRAQMSATTARVSPPAADTAPSQAPR